MGHFTDIDTIVLQWSLVSVSFTFVLVRLYVRGWIQSSLGRSDVLVILAWLLSALSSMARTLCWRLRVRANHLDISVGREAPDLSRTFLNVESHIKIMQLLYVEAIPSFLSLYCVKGSILLFYLQLFPKTDRKLRTTLKFTIWFVVIGLITSLGMNLFWCLPIQRNWSLNHSDMCLSAFSLRPYFTTTIFHIVSDIMIYSLPVFLIKHLRTELRLPCRQLCGLGLVLSLGWITIVCAILKTVNLMHARSGSRNVGMCLWDAIQQALAIIVVCCPPLKWLWHARNGKRGSSLSLIQPTGVIERGSREEPSRSTQMETSLQTQSEEGRIETSYGNALELIVIPRSPDRSLLRGSGTGRLDVRDLEMQEHSGLGILPVFIDIEREAQRGR